MSTSALEEVMGGSGHTKNGVVIISNFQLAALLASVAVVVTISLTLSMGIEKRVIIASVRCFIQLGALGLVLVPIITWNNPLMVFSYICFMIMVGATEASSRPPYFFDALPIICFVALATGVSIFGTYTFYIVLGTGLDAQYAIPIVGMLTGGAIVAVSLSTSNVVTTIAEHSQEIELLLALGATRWEASIETLRKSVTIGLIPMLTVLSVTGLVSIPGMMTGQIIGGTPPWLAARYQLVIMYISIGCVITVTLTAATLTTMTLIDKEHRLRVEKLRPRDSVNRIQALMSATEFLISLFFRKNQATLLDPRLSMPLCIESDAEDTSTDGLQKSANAPNYGATESQ